MTARVSVRQLQQRAGELIDRAAAGERIGITRDGRLVAVLTSPEPERRGQEALVRDGTSSPEDVATARGPADRSPPETGAGIPRRGPGADGGVTASA